MSTIIHRRRRINYCGAETFKVDRSVLLYTFSITWLSWLVIIVANTYFDALWYGEPLFWILMIIGGLGPAIGAYFMHQRYDEDFKQKSFIRFIFNLTVS